ncbi:MAG: recombinase RecT [Sulfitobacter sp.]|uniref:recombinase RecT n=1 Tax=Roseobacteraceae TaxID=2854170 RepID=UPI003266B54F
MSQVAKIPLRQVDSVQKLLMNDMARDQLGAVAAKHMNPERLMRITANAIRTTPKLQQCEPLSFLGALMQCASLGLEPNTVMGHAYLIPFDKSVKNPETGRWEKIPQVQLIIGYKGLIDLARRSGHITSISANIHYDDDELWEYEEGTESRLRHIPGPQDGKPLHAYAIAKFVEGGHAYVVLPWARVMKIRDGSQGWQSAVRLGKTEGNPWHTHTDAMAKKTAIRALSKYLPLSVEFRDAVSVDNDGGAQVDYAKFALNPNEGATIDGEYHEGEADAPEDNVLNGETFDHDPKTGEVKEEPKQQAKREPEKKAAEPETKQEEKKPAEAKGEDKPSEKAADADPGKFAQVMSAIKGDLMDAGAGYADEVLDFYKTQVDEIKAQSPELYDELQSFIAELPKGEEG